VRRSSACRPRSVGDEDVLFVVSVQHYVIGPAARGLWVVGKIGKLLLPNYKRAYAEADAALTMMESALGLSVLGLRHAKLAAEVRKMLGALPPCYGRDPSRPDVHEGVKKLMELMDLAFEDRRWACTFSGRRGRARGSPDRGAAGELVLSLRAARRRPGGSGDDAGRQRERAVHGGRRRGRPAHPFPALARQGPPESLFAPADFLAEVRRPWSPRLAMPLLEGYLAHDRRQALEVRKEPSRNAPCPCGSGKKHKRCCAEERA